MARKNRSDMNEELNRKSGGRNTGERARTTRDAEATIPIIEEKVEVGKREVERGRVKVRSRVEEKPVEEEVKLREEHITVDRRPVDRPADEGDMAAVQGGAIEMTERAEKPVVSKQARVTEEVTIGKQAQERTETVRDTVRRTDVEVEEADASARYQTGHRR